MTRPFSFLSAAFLLAFTSALPAATVSFDAPSAYSVGFGPQSIALGDFNGDGHPDLATTGFAGKVSVLLSDGKGGFLPAVTYNAGQSGISTLIAADFNGDGKLDLAAAGKGVYILLGNGDGTFQKASLYLPFER